jgi:hypothetical protein
MEAEDLGITKTPTILPYTNSQRHGLNQEEFQSPPLCYILHCIDIAGPAPDVHTNDGRCFGRNHLLNLPGIDVMGARVYIAKNRRYFLPLKGIGRCDKRKRWRNNFTFNSSALITISSMTVPLHMAMQCLTQASCSHALRIPSHIFLRWTAISVRISSIRFCNSCRLPILGQPTWSGTERRITAKCRQFLHCRFMPYSQTAQPKRLHKTVPFINRYLLPSTSDHRRICLHL